MQVDVLVLGDLRFPGGTASAIVSDVQALSKAGYRVGLMSFAAGPLSANRAFHPEIAGLAGLDHVDWIAPGTHVEARLCCLHHPAVFETLPAAPFRIRAEVILMIAHHPPLDAEGVAQYDVERVTAITDMTVGPALWAPVGPKVRAAFARLMNPPPLCPWDWPNTINVSAYGDGPRTAMRSRPVIGRHSRPDPLKWPDTAENFLQAYPDIPEVQVRLMGYGEDLDGVIEERPAAWDVLPFNALPVRDFLGTLDIYSYHHSELWIEAFGRSVLEAMAAGLVCHLPEDFEPLFGDGAVYGPPATLMDLVRRCQAEPEFYADQSARAVATARDRFGQDQTVRRVRALIGEPAPRPKAPPDCAPTTVLYFTSNGIGMGHLARCMASARRFDPAIRPVIVTMSKAFDVVRETGIEVEYLPYFEAAGLDHADWIVKLEDELQEILRYHDPQVFVFDGNVPYQGMLNVLETRPAMWRVWQRRPLWRPDAGAHYLQLEPHFDVVLEPGERADGLDRGGTKPRQKKVHQVAPVHFLDPEEALPRSAARTILGLDPGRPAMLVQLGSGNNFDLDEICRLVFEMTNPLRNGRDMQVVLASWRISHTQPDLPAHVSRLDAFPIARYLPAFDCAIAMAGYNTFHENIAAGLPTLFVANDHPQHDEQWLRARHGALSGLSLEADARDPYALRRGLERLWQPGEQTRMAQACRAAARKNGAVDAAVFISQLALTRKPSGLAFQPAPPERVG